MNKIYGRLEAWFETGTEGIVWSVQDPSLPQYDGLFPLCDGDYLEVIDDGWQGRIDLDYERNRVTSSYGYRGQALHGFWVNGVQRRVDADFWFEMFMSHARAVLTPGNQQEARRIWHVFHVPLEELEDRLRELSEDEAQKLFRSSVYPWLVFYANQSDDGQQSWDSLAKSWGFSLDETIKVVGSPSSQQIAAWRHYPKQSQDRLMPFSWPMLLRLALLFRINGRLSWLFKNAEEARVWLADRRDLMMGDLDALRTLIAVLDEKMVGSEGTSHH